MKKTGILIFAAVLLRSGYSFPAETGKNIVENIANKPTKQEITVTTPSGFKEPAVNYPGNVTVINEEEIKRSNAKYVYELLRQESGIYVKDYTHAGKAVLVDMRGFGDTAGRNVLVMLDGRRLNEIDITGTDWKQVPIENVERIEIIRGSGPVLYGDNAVSGVINIITKKGKEGHHFKGGAEFGSYRYSDYHVRVSGAENFASYNIFYKNERTDGYRLNGDYEGTDLMADMSIFPTNEFNLDISGGYHKDWYGLPAGLQRWEIDRIGYRGSTTPNDRSSTETTFIKISPTAVFDSEYMEQKVSADIWGRKKWLNTTTWANFLPFVPWYPSWDTSQVDSLSGTVRYTNKFNADNIENILITGIDLFSAANKLLTVTPQWGTYNQLKITKQTLGLFVTDNINLGDELILNGGFRQEWADYGFDQSENAGRYETKTPDQEAVEFGIEYKYLERGAVYGRFTRSYRFPATEEFYSRWTGLNTGLKHQKADTWEFGVKDSNLSYLQPSINLFWMTSDDEIFYDPTVGAFGDNRNYDRIRRFGVETGVKSRLMDMLTVHGNYTYVNAEFSDGVFAGNKVPMVPEHKVAWGIDITPIEYVVFNFNSEYISKQYPINDQYNRMPELKPYFLCNMHIVLKYKGIEVFFGINNIFDERYAEIAVSNVAGTVTDLHPAPSRNYLFGMSYKF